jgi:bifunctional UDP-N-acetylglucosamine pyrophosphorylase/glucosamine-1-phosphate N-acetyltransferase
VVGHGADAVRAVFRGEDHDIDYALQQEQLGTGHATLCAAPALEARDFRGDVIVLAGDGPLIRPQTIHAMVKRHRDMRAAATLATSVIREPAGYGRIVRDRHGRFQAIVEQRNCSESQRQIHEIYPSYACFDAPLLFETLRSLTPDHVSGEYYLTDVPGRLNARGYRVEVIEAVPPEDVLSINTPQQLAEVDTILAERRRHAAAAPATAPGADPGPRAGGGCA